VTPYLPDFQGLEAVLVTWVIGAILLLAGAGLTGRRVAPEFQIAAGWGALSLILTSWGVFLPLSLRLPAAAFCIAALWVVLVPGRRPSVGAWTALGRMLIISLPLWLIMAPIRPSQPDTFLNLLPNAFYLVDHGRFPSSVLPPSLSYVPGAPYNSQLLSFLGSLLYPDYPASGMSLVNVMLQLVAGLAIARALTGSPLSQATNTPSWSSLATGMLLTTLLNPGFVPRIHFAAYGEPALAATAVVAAWLFVLTQSDVDHGLRATQLLPLALTLAAMVNIKQTGFGLVASFGGAALISAWAEPGAQRGAAVRHVILAVIPAVLLYAIWRYNVVHAGIGELKPLAFSEWNWAHFSETAASALTVVAAKPTYFGCAATAILVLPWLRRRQGWTPTTRLLALNAALFALYNGFIAMTYIAAFPAEMSVEAHSYFRYNTHLSLVLVLSLALAARDVGAAAGLTRERLRLASAAVLVLAVLTPVAFAKRLRFDLDMPQPLVWDVAKKVAGYLQDGDRLALLLPGDNDSVATMLSGVLANTAPRRRNLDLLRRNTADPATLAEAARLGYPLALISCTQGGRENLPPSAAALLRYQSGGWHIVAAWPYPANAAERRWQHILSWAPLCRS
jgi:membrane protein YdbS with pleckstrin-like domain